MYKTVADDSIHVHTFIISLDPMMYLQHHNYTCTSLLIKFTYIASYNVQCIIIENTHLNSSVASYACIGDS